MKKTRQELSTEKRQEQLDGKKDLLKTWEEQLADKQARNHGYLLKLRARIRNINNYIIHRKDADEII